MSTTALLAILASAAGASLGRRRGSRSAPQALTKEQRQLIAEMVRSGDDEQIQQAVELCRALGFPGLVLPYADLSDLDLSGVDFSGADLSCADFTSSWLYNADFSFSILEGAHIGDAYAARADFSGADLREAHIGDSVLSESNFSGADLRNAYLEYASLRDAKFDGVIYDEDTTWPDGFTPPPSR